MLEGEGPCDGSLPVLYCAVLSRAHCAIKAMTSTDFLQQSALQQRTTRRTTKEIDPKGEEEGHTTVQRCNVLEPNLYSTVLYFTQRYSILHNETRIYPTSPFDQIDLQYSTVRCSIDLKSI